MPEDEPVVVVLPAPVVAAPELLDDEEEVPSIAAPLEDEPPGIACGEDELGVLSPWF